MKKTLFLLFGILVLRGRCQAQSPSENRPNVVILYADDLGYGDISANGAVEVNTPHIDALARQGLRFTNGHCTASTCTPSRYSILTGEYAWRKPGTGILPGDAALIIPQDRATLPSLFRQAGYHTAAIGKWHLGLGGKGGPDWNGIIKPGPDEVGFDYCFIFPATADRVPTVYIENHRVVARDSSDPIRVNYHQKVGNDPTGKENPERLKMKSTPGQGHDGTIVNGIGRIGWMSGGNRARWVDEALEADFTDQAEQFIRENQHHPFFLYFALSDIHVPRMPDTRFKGKSKLGYRGDAILEMDYAVGAITRMLKDLGLEDNTIVIFTSDNGPVLNDGYLDGAVKQAHGHKPAGEMRGGKYSILEGGTRVPLIIRWPGTIKPHTTSAALVSQVDFLASFAQMLDQPLGKVDGPDSFQMLDALLGRNSRGRTSYVEQGRTLALVNDGWKYIEPHGGPAMLKAVQIASGLSKAPQLYHLPEDLSEESNLADRYPARVKLMAEQLQAVREKGYSRPGGAPAR